MGESVLPKRLFKPGSEPQVCQINNSCKMTLMTKIKNILPEEYNEVKMDPMFYHVLAIHDNVLGYSARLIHNMMCRQLVTRKGHELWCVFGGRPLRFSLQEFHAITGLKSINDGLTQDPEKWKDDNGFWGKILKKKEKISIKTILEKHLSHAKNWNRSDRLRLVYLCVIAGLVMARDEKKEIPHSYIKLVIDIELFKTYPWGIHSFDLLITSIIKTRDNLKNPKSYILDGFSYAFQIWVMEAIPSMGTLLGNKVDVTLDHGPRCSNWKGASKLSYDDIIQLESTFAETDVIYPYISIMGYNDVVHHIDFIWPDELNDDEVEKMQIFMSAGYLFGEHIWESVTFGENCESINQELDEMGSSEDVVDVPNLTYGLRMSRKRIHDQGAEKRRKKMLWEQATGKQGGVEEDMKLFIQEIFNEAFSSFASKLEKKIDERMEKIETKVSKLSSDLLSAPEFHEDTTTTPKPPKTDNSRRHTRVSKNKSPSD